MHRTMSYAKIRQSFTDLYEGFLGMHTKTYINTCICMHIPAYNHENMAQKGTPFIICTRNVWMCIHIHVQIHAQKNHVSMAQVGTSLLISTRASWALCKPHTDARRPASFAESVMYDRTYVSLCASPCWWQCVKMSMARTPTDSLSCMIVRMQVCARLRACTYVAQRCTACKTPLFCLYYVWLTWIPKHNLLMRHPSDVWYLCANKSRND
jgi:hypothetical protein